MRKVKLRKSSPTPRACAAAVLRPQRDGPRQEVEVQRRLEDAGGHGARIQVGDLRRVEAGLGDREGVAQHLGCRRGPSAALRRRPQARRSSRPQASASRRQSRSGSSGAVGAESSAWLAARSLHALARAANQPGRAALGRPYTRACRSPGVPTCMAAYLIRRLWQMVPDAGRRGAAGVLAVQVLRRRPGRDPGRPERHAGADRRHPPAARPGRAGWVQLGIFVKQIVTFDWGKSWATNEAVAQPVRHAAAGHADGDGADPGAGRAAGAADRAWAWPTCAAR